MTDYTLADLGWSNHFATQIEGSGRPARVTAVHRSAVDIITDTGTDRIGLVQGDPIVTAGDWVLIEGCAITRLLDRQSLLKRRAAGDDPRRQLIAANVTTLGIVTSCNDDFNPARIERYLVLAADAGCLPLVILTKADKTDDPRHYQREAERLSPILTAIAINAKAPEDIDRLAPWCRQGVTLALVGSSGVGKTTIRNALTGEAAATQDIREDDAKGRHTTTVRALVPTRHGGWLIDTPGMRALRLEDVSDGISAVFEDIESLALTCRFSDCAHDTEPGCAVQAALAAGTLDADRIRRWQKLRAEEERNSETIAEARARGRGFAKMVKGVKEVKRRTRGD